MNNLIIRNEVKKDYRIVENITREAFWNLHAPGCDEHYLAHILRKHKDFVPELDLVAELEGNVVSNIMYTKSKLIDEEGKVKSILTFGPLSVLPKYQYKGVGKTLLEHSFKKVLELGYDTIVIFGNPGNYISRGFKSCKKYNVCLENDVFPTAMLVKELRTGVLNGIKWKYFASSVYNINKEEALKFDKLFEFKQKEYKTSQEEFYIYSNSTL
ncbi:MAG: N-acetyltransferase [Clostridiales bacterium]